jgi:hypothetical protein
LFFHERTVFSNPNISNTYLPTFADLSIFVTHCSQKASIVDKMFLLFFSSEGDFASLDSEVQQGQLLPL